jgi:hypothetical protein
MRPRRAAAKTLHDSFPVKILHLPGVVPSFSDSGVSLPSSRVGSLQLRSVLAQV